MLFTNWLRANLFQCPVKRQLSIDCPGCGFQRSVIALLEGDLLKSLQLYPATLPLFMLLVYSVAHLKFDFIQGARNIKILYISVSFIVIIHYIYKIFTHQLI